ncbi:MAG: glycosyltransferase [Clostridia bacterium]|nr:glycosyltransferase [Clostridia bacterium]
MKKNKVKNIVSILIVILSNIYIIWRFATLPIGINAKSVFFSCLLLFFELIEHTEFMVFYFNTFISKDIKVKNSKLGKEPNIDVLIPTINEAYELIEETIKACTEIEYANKFIYLLDDGNRKEIKELAEKYNIHYVARVSHENAKAGNLNYALNLIKSEYILVLDCDMKPKKTIINDIMPYFADETVGFVQTPQCFENPDIYQYRFELFKSIPNSQNYFYQVLQEKKNNINAVVFCGTNAIIKREALDKIGGFATGSITEDIATGMLIENAGYKGIYVNQAEAFGIQENELGSFIRQRSRWCRGCLQVGKDYRNRNYQGLNIRQKLEYFTSIYYWLFGIKRIFFLLLPILYSFFGIVLIKANLLNFLVLWFPQYILKRLYIDKVYHNKRSSTWNKLYQIILSPVLAKEAILELIGIRKKKFEVSSKTKKGVQNKKYQIELATTHTILLFLNIVGYFISLFRIKYFSYYILTLVWNISNMGYLILALIFDLSNKERNDYLYVQRDNYSKMSLIKIVVGEKNE